MSNLNQDKNILISWVIPCFNEAEVIKITIKRIKEVIAQANSKYDQEIIFIDDGSNDGTGDIIKSLTLLDSSIKLLVLSRNFGHQAALQAGLNFSSGDAVIIIDADLQDPPEVAIEMINLWEKGFDVIYGKRDFRRSETIFKKITARFFYKLVRYLSDFDIPIDTGDFRLIDRKVVNALKDMPEKSRYMRGLISWTGFNQTYVSYIRDQRFAGKTKYSLRRMINLAIDGLTAFSKTPLRLATYFGFITAVFSTLGIVYVLIVRLLTSIWVAGWATLTLAILMTSSVQLFCLGIIGEYIGRNYLENKRRPLYLVKEKFGFKN